MSDIRKIQTGNNQYTLHARVSDKLAVNAQIGSDTKPVYVDSSGQVQACSREIPTVPYSVTKINECLIDDFYYDVIYSYDDPNENYEIRSFFLKAGDKIIVNTTDSYDLPLYVVNDDESFKLEVRVNTSVTVPVTVEDEVECFLRGQQHQPLPTGYVEIYRGNSTTTDTFRSISNDFWFAFSRLLSKYQADDLYAKKTDVSTVYRYKGNAYTLAQLPAKQYLSESNAGDVWNIETASTDGTLTVKSGDNVAWVWDSTTKSGHWDNLSGTVDLSNYLQKGGKQTTTSTADGGSNVYTFKDGSTITVKNGSKGSTGAAGTSATWFSGGAVTGTSTTAKTFNVPGSKAGDMYLNTGTSNVYKATAANQWVYLCNIKGPQGTPGNNGTTPTIRVEAGGNIGVVGTPEVSANTSGTTTTFTFNHLKGQKGDTGATVTWHTGTAISSAGVHAIASAKLGDMYLNTTTCDVFKATNAVQGVPNWSLVCNIKGAKGDAADIPKLAKGVAGIVPGTINDSLSASRWLNGGDNGTGSWRALPTAAGGTSGMVRTCKDYTGSIDPTKISGYAHATTPPTIQPITTGASDYRGVESDGSGRLFVNVPAYEKNANTAQNTVLAAPTSGAGTATFRKLTSSDIPWNERFKVMTPAQYKASTKLTNVFYFILEE